MIVEHPEFEAIKEKAKNKVIERVTQYKKSFFGLDEKGSPDRKKLFAPSLSITSSPEHTLGGLSPYRSVPLSEDSPFLQKHREVGKVRRRINVASSRLQFQQFVQSDVF